MTDDIIYYQKAYIPSLYCKKCRENQSAEVVWQNDDAESLVRVRCDHCELEYDLLPQTIERLSFEYISGVKELLTSAQAGDQSSEQ